MTKTKPKPWVVGDALVVNGTRWGIDVLIGDHVELKALSTTNHGVRWTTTLNNLPRKAA